MAEGRRVGDLQGSSDESDKVSNDASTKSQDDSVPGALVEQQEILDLSLSFAALGCLPGWDDKADEPGLGSGCRLLVEGGLEDIFEGLQVELGNVSVGNEDIGGGRKGGDNGVGNVRNQVETTVDGILAEDGYFKDIRLCHWKN